MGDKKQAGKKPAVPENSGFLKKEAKPKEAKKEASKQPGKADKAAADNIPSVITGEECPMCHNKTLTLTEAESEIPFFGKTYLFSMNCNNCGYHKADVEADEQKEPSKYTIETSSEDDMKIRVIKSSNATVKIPHVGNIEPGEASNGYITNIEGLLQRMKKMVEILRDDSEDEEDKKKAKNILKKLLKVMWGQEKLKIIIEDPSGNSAIISDKAVKSKL